MKIVYHAGLFLYGAGMAGIAFQQFYYNDFRPVILPEDWPGWIHASPLWAYNAAILFIAAAVMIVATIRITVASLFLGLLLLLFFLAFHLPYRLKISPDSPYHLGVWTNALKELALSGSAFIITGSVLKDNRGYTGERLDMTGRVFFSTMLILFGYAHFLYPAFVSTLIPAWINGSLFWTYFAGIALIGSGLGIIFRVQLQLVAMLTGIMILVWAFILHFPRAVAAAPLDKGNEMTSLFEALAFSGTAFVIAYVHTVKIEQLE